MNLHADRGFDAQDVSAFGRSGDERKDTPDVNEVPEATRKA